MLDSASSRSGLATGLTTAVVGVLATFTVWWLILRTHDGQVIDSITSEGMVAVFSERQWQDVESVLRILRVAALIGLFLAAALLIIHRRQWFATAQALVLVVGATGTAVVMNELSPNLARLSAFGIYPFDQTVDLTTTLFACAGVAVIIAAQPASRPVVAVLSALMVGALTAGQLVSYAMRPSPLVLAMLVTTAWLGLVTAGTVVARRSGNVESPPANQPASRSTTAIGVVTLVLIGGTAAIISSVIITQWMNGTLSYSGRQGYQAVSFLGGAFAVGATACLTAAAVLVAVQAVDRTGPTTRRSEETGQLTGAATSG